MIQNQYQMAYSATSGTFVVGAGNLTVHTITSPIASSGTIKLKNPTTFVSIADLPIGTIGSLRLDASFPAGLSVALSANDAVIVTYQIP